MFEKGKGKRKDSIGKSGRTLVLHESVQHTGPGGTEGFNVSNMNSIRISLNVQKGLTFQHHLAQGERPWQDSRTCSPAPSDSLLSVPLRGRRSDKVTHTWF